MGLLQKSELEHVKAVSLKSIMDQLTEAYQKIAALQRDMESIHGELNEKINLSSRANDDFTTFTKLGQGTVNVNGASVAGIGTRFKSQITIGSQLKVGAETSTVRTIANDANLTVDPAFANVSSNAIYAVIQTGTREVLAGKYAFGEVNGTPFHGVVRTGSILESNGRMTNPTDVPNLGYVQKALAPLMALGNLAISREGDEIGTSEAPTNFDYKNCQIELDANSHLYINSDLPSFAKLKSGTATPDSFKLVPSLKYLLDNVGAAGINCAQFMIASIPKVPSDPKSATQGLALNNATPIKASAGFNNVLNIKDGIITCLQQCQVDIHVRGEMTGNFPSRNYAIGMEGYIRFCSKESSSWDTVLDYSPIQLICNMICSVNLEVGDKLLVSMSAYAYTALPCATISIRTFS